MTGVDSLLVREATVDELAGWDRLIDRFPHRIYHTLAWLRSIEAFSGARAIFLVFERNGSTVACLPGFLVTVGLLRLFASPLEGWQTEQMGPVFDSDEVQAPEIAAATVAFLERRFKVHQIELAAECMDHASMGLMGFTRQRLFTYRAPLWPNDEALALKTLDKKTRNQLRKAQKLGLHVRLGYFDGFIPEFMAQTRAVYGRHQKAVPFSPRRITTLIRHLEPSGNLLLITIYTPDGTRCIATGVFFVHKRELTLWAWTHLAEFGSLCPIELLTWTAMQSAMEKGCTVFQMTGGGAGKPKFGGVPFEGNFRYIRSRYRWLATARRVARGIYRWQQGIRGSMGAKLRLLPERVLYGVNPREVSR